MTDAQGQTDVSGLFAVGMAHGIAWGKPIGE